MNKNGTSVWGDLNYCHDLYTLIKKEKPDVTLGYTIKPVVYGAIAAHLAGVKNINSMVTGGGYTFIATSFKARILGFIVRCLYRIGFRMSDHIIFQNPDDLNEFCDRRLAQKSKCFVVNGSGVNVAHFHVEQFPEKTSFFMLSRLLKSKGVQEYLKAAEIVKERYPDTKFYLIGNFESNMQDAIPREFVESFMKRGIVERFEETSDVRPYYAMSSVYVLPSYREGTPRTVLEAMAMGRPIITTDTQGCRETVMDGQNGYLVPVGDYQTLASRMIHFICEPELIASMGEKSRAYVIEKFEVNKVNADMKKIMQISL
jgi:glycosyltransferase involved in cell wall biosynthesis